MGFFDLEELDGEAVDSVSEVLESIRADLGGRVAITPHELVRGFLESTPALTSGEQARLLGGVIEDQRAARSTAGSSSAGATPSGSSRPSGSTSARDAGFEHRE